MDFLRIAGNEKMLNSWIEYLVRCNVIRVVEDNSKKVYRKTDAGDTLHDLLKLHPYLGSILRDIGRNRRQES